MRTLMEHQLSWFALLMTAFYSLLASCRGEECGHEELTRCARPLKKFSNNNDLSFVTKKEDLQELCPDLQAGMKCIKTYTVKCMADQQREHFNSLYTGTNQAIMELCQDGPYQDEYLRHAPCMQNAKKEYDLCYKKYERATQEIERENRTTGNPNDRLKSVCCVFKEYLECSHHTVRRQCGDDTARFTKEFLDRMSNSLLKMHCAKFSHEECMGSGAGGRTWNKVESIVPVLVFVFLARYFT